jgi:hypothetical protein
MEEAVAMAYNTNNAIFMGILYLHRYELHAFIS